MIISEIIEKLENFKKKFRDVEVYISCWDDCFNSTVENFTNDVALTDDNEGVKIY